MAVAPLLANDTLGVMLTTPSISYRPLAQSIGLGVERQIFSTIQPVEVPQTVTLDAQAFNEMMLRNRTLIQDLTTQHTLMQHLVQPTQMRQQGNVVTLPDGSQYEGDLNDNDQPHGNGTLTYPDGHICNYDTYTGRFRKGVPHGYGRITQTNGDTFQGMMENGMPDEGTFTAADQDPTLTGTFYPITNGNFTLKNGKEKWLGRNGWRVTQYRNGKQVYCNKCPACDGCVIL